MISKIVLASNNAGKLAEFERLLAPLSIQVQAQSAYDVPECDEPFNTFIENALRKARHTAHHTGLPALADDSGVCVPALNGAPGVFSARYASLFTPVLNPDLDKDTQNNQQLIHNLRRLDGLVDKKNFKGDPCRRDRGCPSLYDGVYSGLRFGGNLVFRF